MAEKDKYSKNLKVLTCSKCGRKQLKGVGASTCVKCGGAVK